MATPSQDDIEQTSSARINGGCLLIAFLGLPIIAVTLFGYRMFIATEVGAEVLGHRWERIVEVETLITIDGGVGLCREVEELKDAYNVVERELGENEGHTGYGFCSYQIDSWEVTSTERSGGEGLDPAPSWPAPEVTNCTERGCTREGRRGERYFVDLLDEEGERHECNFREDDWRSLKPGSRSSGKKSIFLDAIACRSFLD